MLYVIACCVGAYLHAHEPLPPYLHGGSFLRWSFVEYPFVQYLKHKNNFGIYQLNKYMSRNTLHTINDDLIDQVEELSVDFMFTVKVLLEEIEDTDKMSWKLTSNSGFVFRLGSQAQRGMYDVNTLDITCARGVLYINGKRVATPVLRIEPREGLLSLHDKLYPGSLVFIRRESSWLVVNFVDIEDYIYGVLRWESWPGWPIEVNKAFAIACRSYVIKRILESRNSKRLYHIKNTNIHQTYRGIHINEQLLRAVEETKGIILTYNSRPIEAMFDSCCGGIIPAHIEGVNFEKSPYLARTYACTFCKPCKIYSWKTTYSVDTIKQLLEQLGTVVKDIKHVHIARKDKAGSVRTLQIHDHDRVHEFTGRESYKLFSHLKSFCYGVEKKGSDIHFNGKGYGHHLGMCQWGARYMVDAGWNYQRILQFYYPGTEFMKLKKGSSSCQDIKVT